MMLPENWYIMIPRTDLPTLTPEQLEVLRRFSVFQADIDDVRRSLAGIFEFDFDSKQRIANTHFRVPEPGILVTRDHIASALEREERGQISQQELIGWATMLLLNDAYQPDPQDEDFVAEWLNRMSDGFDPA
jgi:hypothetical protein